jgi:hypothetical protein
VDQETLKILAPKQVVPQFMIPPVEMVSILMLVGTTERATLPLAPLGPASSALLLLIRFSKKLLVILFTLLQDVILYAMPLIGRRLVQHVSQQFVLNPAVVKMLS